MSAYPAANRVATARKREFVPLPEIVSDGFKTFGKRPRLAIGHTDRTAGSSAPKNRGEPIESWYRVHLLFTFAEHPLFRPLGGFTGRLAWR
jgi:hypothetical protein